jgi:cytochrome c-type biogenesis protein CcmH
MRRTQQARRIASLGVLVAVAMTSLITGAVGAVERTEPVEESRVRAVASGLRCAVCQNQSVYESNSDLAKDMLRIIREKVRNNESDTQIRTYFRDRYGDYVYLEPTREGGNYLLWVAPFLALLGGSVWLGLFLKRKTRPSAPGTTPIAGDDGLL